MTVRIVWMAAAVLSCVFGVLFSLQVNGMFREQNPAGYARVERTFNRVPALLERAAGVRHGSWELKVEFPRGVAGRAETLLTVGEPPNVDRVFVRYLDERRLQLGFARPAMPEALGPPLAFTPGRSHRLLIALGAMLPPASHPWFAGMPPDLARLASRLVWAEVDGQTALRTFRRFDRTGSRRIRAGPRSLGDETYPRFTGSVLSAGRESLEPSRLAGIGHDELRLPRADEFRLALAFPPGRVGEREPLIASGATGEGDIIGVEYLADGAIRLFLDHWGSPLRYSGRIALDRAVPHDLAIALSWLGAGRGPGPEIQGEVRVELDGALVWQVRTPGYRADPEEVTVGENRIGGSHCGPVFSGTIRGAERLASRANE